MKTRKQKCQEIITWVEQLDDDLLDRVQRIIAGVQQVADVEDVDQEVEVPAHKPKTTRPPLNEFKPKKLIKPVHQSRAIDDAVEFSHLSFTDLVDQIKKLKVNPTPFIKGANSKTEKIAKLAAFLKRVYQAADRHDLDELHAMAEKRMVKIVLGQGRQTDEGRLRKAAAQLLAAGAKL